MWSVSKEWVKGNPPEGTYGWGAVVLEDKDPRSGFRFASFGGDHVHLDREDGEEIPFNKIAYWTNPIVHPIPQEIIDQE